MVGLDAAIVTEAVPLPVDHVAAAALVLAAAFEHDPFYSWLVPDPATRVDGLAEYFAAKLARRISDGPGWVFITATGSSILVGEHVEVGAGSNDGPALPSDSRDVLSRWVTPEHLEQVAAVFEVMPHPAYDHAYLDVIATIPSAQGRGEGSALARHWLRSLPATTRHVHLDSSSPLNIPFYERLGFCAGPTVELPHGAGNLTPMDLELPTDH